MHLHVASGYSMRYGASHLEALARRAAERGMEWLALTDRDNVTGAVRFAKACAEQGVRPIFGVDLAVAATAPASKADRERTPVRGGAHAVEPKFRVPLLARDVTGWARLCRLVSAAHADAAGGPPAATWAALREHAGPELLVLLGPMAEPMRALSAGRPDIAKRLLVPWRAVLGDSLRMEVLWYGLSGTGPGSLRLAAHTLSAADQWNIPCVLTNGTQIQQTVTVVRRSRQVVTLGMPRVTAPVLNPRPERPSV